MHLIVQKIQYIFYHFPKEGGGRERERERVHQKDQPGALDADELLELSTQQAERTATADASKVRVVGQWRRPVQFEWDRHQCNDDTVFGNSGRLQCGEELGSDIR